MILLAIFLFTGSGGDENSKSTNSDLEKSNTKVEVQKAVDLGITVEKFQADFNQNALEKNLPQMQISGFEFGAGNSPDTIIHKFIDTFYLYGKVNSKTGNIKSISVVKALVFSGSDRKAEAVTAAAAFLIMVKTLSPELTAEERAAIIKKFSASNKPYVAVTEGNIKYNQAFMEDGKVLMLSADIKD